MRRLMAAAMVAVLAGCAANSQVSNVPSVAGTYKLIAVDGQAVPQAIASGEEVVSGKLELKADGTFEVTTQLRAQMTSLEPLAFTRQQLGLYQASQIGLHMKWQNGTEASAAFFGKTLRFYVNGVEYLYLK